MTPTLNDEHESDSSSGKIPITQQELQDLLTHINNSANNPPEYDLPGGQQCTTWALDSMVQANIIPDNIAADFDYASALDTIMHNPYTQKIGFSLYDFMEWLGGNPQSQPLPGPADFINYLDMNKDNPYTSANATELSIPIYRAIDPLVLDLNGDGISTIAVSDSNAYFDFDADGFAEKSGWIDASDGFLALDKNANGKVDDISELFGNDVISGFEALEAYDSNADGIIDINDTIFSELKIWRDSDGDAQTDEGEMVSLNDAGIVSINLNHNTTGIVNNGNVITHESSFTKTDGEVLSIVDVNFDVDQFQTHSIQEFDFDIQTLFLPWLRGSGTVADFSVALSTDNALKGLVEDISEISDADILYLKMDNLLEVWTQTNTIDDSVMRGAVKEKIVSIVERFTGEEYQRTVVDASIVPMLLPPPPRDSVLIGIMHMAVDVNNNSYGLTAADVETYGQVETDVSEVNKIHMLKTYNLIKDRMFINFVAQSDSSAEYGLTYDYMSDSISYDNAAIEQNIVNGFYNGNISISLALANVLDNLGELNIETINLFDEEIGKVVDGYVNGDAASYFVNNYMGGMEDDIIIGSGGNDDLSGDMGNDTLYGNTGNDMLNGGMGDDTYIFNLGDGQDTISDYEGTDKILFGEGISHDDIAIYLDGENLILNYGNTNEITIENQSNIYDGIERVELTNGLYLNNNDIDFMVQNMVAYSEDTGIALDNINTVMDNQGLMQIVNAAWHNT